MMRGAPYILLLTGTPGVGKTTVIRRVAAGLGNVRLGGFYTEEIRERGTRLGFRLVGFEGSERVIAHIDFPQTHRMSKYGVDVAALDAAKTLLAPDPNVRLYLVDEIGKMECLSARFVAAMRALVAGTTPVVAAVALKGAGFIAEVKRTPCALLWEVTRTNRDSMPARVIAWLERRA